MPSLKNIKISSSSCPPPLQPPPPPPCEEASPPLPPPPSPPPPPSSHNHSSCSPCQHKNHSPPPPPPAAPAPAPAPPPPPPPPPAAPAPPPPPPPAAPAPAPPHPPPPPLPSLSPPPGNIVPPPKKPPIVAPPRPSTPPPFYPAIAPSPYFAPPLGSQVLSIAPMPAPHGGYNTPLVVGTSLSGLLFLSFIALGLNYFLPKKSFVPGSGGHGAPPTGGDGGPPLSQPSGNAAVPAGNNVHATSHVGESNIIAPGSEGTSAPPPDKPPAPSILNAEPKQDIAKEKPEEQVDEGEDEREKRKKFKGDTVIQTLNETTMLLRKLLAASNTQRDPAGPSQQEFAPEKKKDGEENEEEEEEAGDGKADTGESKADEEEEAGDAKADTGESKADEEDDALNTAMLAAPSKPSRKNRNYLKSHPDSASHDLEEHGDDEEPAADDEEGGESEFQNLQTHEDNPEKDSKEHDGGEGDDAIKPSRQRGMSASRRSNKKPLGGPRASQGSRSNNNTRAELAMQCAPAAMTLMGSAMEGSDGEDNNEEPNANKDASGDDGLDMSSQFSEGKKLATDIIHSDNKQARPRPVPTSRRQQTPRPKQTTHQLHHNKIQQDSRTQSNQTAIGDEGGTGDIDKDPKDCESNLQDPSDPAGQSQQQQRDEEAGYGESKAEEDDALNTTMLQGDDEGPDADEEGDFPTEDNPDDDDSKKTKEHDDGDDVSNLIRQSVMAPTQKKNKKKKPLGGGPTSQGAGARSNNNDFNKTAQQLHQQDSQAQSNQETIGDEGGTGDTDKDPKDGERNFQDGGPQTDGTVDEEYESGLDFAGLDMGMLIGKGAGFLSSWTSKVEKLVEKNAMLVNELMRKMNEPKRKKGPSTADNSDAVHNFLQSVETQTEQDPTQEAVHLQEADKQERSTFPNDDDKDNIPKGNDKRERRVPKSEKGVKKSETQHDKAPGNAVTCGSDLVMGVNMFEGMATDDGAKEETEYNTGIPVVEEDTVDDTSSLTSAQEVADHEDNPDVAIAQNQDADAGTGEFEERQAKSQLADESEAGVKYNERKGNTKAARARARPTATGSVLKLVAQSNVPMAADEDIVEENEKDTEEIRGQDESGIMSSLDTESIILKAEGTIKGREEGAHRQKTKKAETSTLSGVIGNQSFLGLYDRQVSKGSDEQAKGNLPTISGALKRQAMPEFTNPPGPDPEEDTPEFQAASILDADMVTGEFGQHQNVAAESEGVKNDKRRGNIKAPGKGKGVPTTSSTIFKRQVMSELTNPLGLDPEEGKPKFHEDIVATMSSTPDADMETVEFESQEQHQNVQRLDSVAKKIILPQKHEPLLKGNVGHKRPVVTKTSQVKQTKGLSLSDALVSDKIVKEEQNDEKLQCSETTEIVVDDVAAADADAEEVEEEEEEQSATAA